ncbi:MAG: hypothetical protein U0795_01860 [Pirellulales bacterium]
MQVRWVRFGMVFGLVVAAGCSRDTGPARPSFNPQSSAAKAIELYDTDKDGAISKAEVKSSPGLREAFARTDKDNDGKLTAAEIAERIQYYKTAPTTIVQGSTRVTYKGQPLIGATVTFEPESFLGDQFTACSGETDETGVASITGHDAGFPGLYLGFYRVRITKSANGKEAVPAKYNTETTLGYEATDDIPQVADIISFKLN